MFKSMRVSNEGLHSVTNLPVKGFAGIHTKQELAENFYCVANLAV